MELCDSVRLPRKIRGSQGEPVVMRIRVRRRGLDKDGRWTVVGFWLELQVSCIPQAPRGASTAHRNRKAVKERIRKDIVSALQDLISRLASCHRRIPTPPRCFSFLSTDGFSKDPRDDQAAALQCLGSYDLSLLTLSSISDGPGASSKPTQGLDFVLLERTE